jgi:5S rRNA maturation endonuclease (ribonuclease M5)/archaellum biogenesis ATPase FlaH
MILEPHKNWFENERGITGETLEAFGVESTSDEWVSLPYDTGNRSRKMLGPREFRFTKGSKISLFHPKAITKDSYVVLCEGETDTMRLWQEGVKSVYGLPGFNSFSDDVLAPLHQYDTVFVVLDNDTDYNVRTTVDGAWGRLRGILGTKAKRIELPTDVKDVCEFFDSYSIDTFREITKESMNGNYHYKPLDLSLAPPDYDWLVQGLICKGDVTLLVGEPNVGKSWVSLSLAVAMADQQSKWLGYDMAGHGKVLYIDEENPHDVVYHRLKQLGIQQYDNVRYLHRQGIRLDRNFDKILDEAIAYEPSLIVLDSLTRFHTKDENNAGEMAKLFNDSINVMCRETGAAILILHHTNKSESTSSYVRTRGSSDIGAAVDCGIECRKREHETNSFNLVQFKSRRSQVGGLTKVSILDNINGQVELVTQLPPC